MGGRGGTPKNKTLPKSCQQERDGEIAVLEFKAFIGESVY